MHLHSLSRCRLFKQGNAKGGILDHNHAAGRPVHSHTFSNFTQCCDWCSAWQCTYSRMSLRQHPTWTRSTFCQWYGNNIIVIMLIPALDYWWHHQWLVDFESTFTTFQSTWKTYHVVQPLPLFLWRSHLWTIKLTRSILDIFPLVFLHLVNIVYVHRLMSQMPRCTFQFKEVSLEEWFKREIECPDSRPNVDKQVGCSTGKYRSLQLVGQPRSHYLHTIQYYPTPSTPSTQYRCTIKAFS